MKDEQTLVEEGRNGSHEAFAALIGLHQKRVYHLAYRMMGNHEDAQDVAQEAFIKAWTALPNFKGDSSFATWMFRLTSNTAIDAIRKQKNKQSVSLTQDYPDENEAVELQIPDKGSSPEESLLQRELGDAIAEGLAQLPELHRSVLIMREIDGMSYQEISTTLDVDLGTIKSRIARGRKRLRDFLKEKEWK